MKRILFLISIMLLSSQAFSQSLVELFDLIEQNNASLKVYSAKCNAEKLDAYTGITLADPEVEFGYLWGTPGEIGNRKDFSITQSFDLATLFGARRKEANSKAELAEIEYEQAKNLVFFSAQQTVIEITYLNKKAAELQKRLDTAKQLEKYYRKLLNNGEVNKIEVGRAQLARVSAEAELKSVQVERNSLVSKLDALCRNAQENDAVPAALLNKFVDSELYPSDYFEGDLTLSVHKQEANLASQQIESAKKEGLPEIKAGYMSELTVGEKFRGLTIGVSIPLWKNRNNVSRAKAQYVLAMSSAAEVNSQLNAQRKELTEKQESLQELINFIQSSLQSLNATPLLLKALNAGEMSLVDFVNDRANYYELTDKLLDAEKDYEIAKAELAFLP
ncbi:MAG: TolC family protein [Prevotellaceae bacterium]|nr:TolC family protein [Candidatus Minthosoma caballi]